MQVNNVRVYNLPEAIVTSGFPMLVDYEPNQVESIMACVKAYIEESDKREQYMSVAKPHIDRMIRLASAPSNSGHPNAMTGILVSFTVTASNTWLLQAERYHFLQIVSCQSKMHRLTKILKESRTAVELLDEDDLDWMQKCVEAYEAGEIDEENLIYSCPMGLQLTCGMVTNYLQLKNIYHQRKNHKLAEWKRFCGWIETLPMARELIVGKVNEEEAK